ncbi:response regulator [Candidatus Leptofilum sp.]|uniref:response regulator n=1 Tax=Candidatus Leptofilum sp. TaxID=3241576 RepID=UPI003B5B6ACD
MINIDVFEKRLLDLNKAGTMSNPLMKLLKDITNSYDLDELKTLCIELGVSYDNLSGDNKLESKAREMILHMCRRNKLNILLTALQNTRPHLFERELNQNYIDTLYDSLQIFNDNKNLDQGIHDSGIPVERGKIKALIVEDIPSQQNAIQQILHEIGANVTIANNLDSALGFIRLTKFELITLDMQLDEMDSAGQVGIMLLDQLRTYQREAVVIIISGLPWSGENVRDFLRDYKAYDYLKKPFKPDELKMLINEAFPLPSQNKN